MHTKKEIQLQRQKYACYICIKVKGWYLYVIQLLKQSYFCFLTLTVVLIGAGQSVPGYLKKLLPYISDNVFLTKKLYC